nr:hypothetical protein [uncultured Draconibacterium sp.]
MTGKVKYGWKSASGVQQYVYQRGINWGVTENFDQASSFNDINICVDHWRSKHAIPEKYEYLLTRNHLQFFNSRSGQQLMYFYQQPQKSDIEIGSCYRYPYHEQEFKLIGMNKTKTSFYFECGHWCTDTVFRDLIKVKQAV